MGQADVGHLVGVGRAAHLELILLFLYIGFIALQASIDDPRRADKAGAVLALVGVVEHSDHLFLGEVVEYAAPGLFGQPDQVAVDGHPDAVGHAADGAELLDVQHRRGALPGAHHHAGAGARHRVGQEVLQQEGAK